MHTALTAEARPSYVLGSPSDASAALVLAAHAVVTAVFIGGILVASWFAPGHEALMTPLSGLLLGLCVWMIVSWKLAGAEFLDPYGLFMVAAMPFHAGFALMRLLGLEWPMLLLARVSDAAVSQTLLLVMACFLALHLGALIARVWPAGAPGPERAGPRRSVGDPDLVLVGAVLLAVSAIPMFLQLRGLVAVAFQGGYLEIFLLKQESGGAGGGLGALLNLISPFFLPGCMFVIAGSGDRTFVRWMAVVLLLVYSAVYLFVGFRAFALLPLVSLVWVWHHRVRRLPVGLLGSLGVAGLLLVGPVIRAFRSLSGSDRLSLTAIESAIQARETPFVDFISELGGSMFTVTFTTELVPSARDFEWGLTYARTALHAVPIVNIPNEFGYAGDWLAWELRPDWAEQGFGYGYSFIAEAYLNFGWLGAPILVILLGIVLARLGMWALRTNDPVRVAFVASFLPLLIFSVRGESLALARPVLWYALIPMGVVHLLRHLRVRLRPGEAS